LNSVNRQEAITVIKQIFNQCPTIEGKSITLMPPKGNNYLSTTFQIQIQADSSLETIKSCTEDIVEEHNLAVKIKGSLIIIYKSYPNIQPLAKIGGIGFS
jgi:hypothetical protein